MGALSFPPTCISLLPLFVTLVYTVFVSSLSFILLVPVLLLSAPLLSCLCSHPFHPPFFPLLLIHHLTCPEFPPAFISPLLPLCSFFANMFHFLLYLFSFIFSCPRRTSLPVSLSLSLSILPPPLEGRRRGLVCENC